LNNRVKLCFYEPSLTRVQALFTNFMSNIVQNVTDSNEMVLEPSSHSKFLRAFIRVFAHVHLSKAYAIGGMETDSPKKVLTHSLGDHNWPRYLIGLAREVIRPQGDGYTLFIPYLDTSEADDYVPVTSSLKLGTNEIICKEYAAFFASMQKHVDLQMRPVTQEAQVLISPLGFTDGEFIFKSEHLSTWRASCFYATQVLRNGANVAIGKLKSWGIPATEPVTIDPTPVRWSRRYLVQTNWITELDQEPMIIPEGIETAANGMRLLQAILSGLPYKVNSESRGQWFIHYDDDRGVKYSDWIRSREIGRHGLPPIDRQEKSTRLIEFWTLFPSEDVHSRTPKSNGPKPGKHVQIKPEPGKTTLPSTHPVEEGEEGKPAQIPRKGKR